jgi:polyferredoxin
MYQKTRKAVSTLSLILFPVTFYYFSPVIPLGGATQGILAGSLMLFVFLFFFSMIMGRVFCSWICPAGALQDLTAESRTRRVSIKHISWIKYFIWVPWLALVFFLFRRAGGIQSADFFYQTEMGISTTSPGSAIVYTIVILVFFILSMVAGRRTACHTICWMSPFMILGGKLGSILRIPVFKVKAKQEKCVSCGRCVKVCPMSLPVDKLIQKGHISGSNCILCGKCVDTCGRDVLSMGWK